jgi:predicted component of type VI protein secretion system
VLALLQRLTPQAPVATPTAHSGPSARELELEDEVARLKAERDARPAPAASSSPELVAGLAKAIGLSSRDVTAAAGDPAGQARLAAVVGTLVDFAVSLLRAYIPVTEDEDRSVAKMVNGLVSDAVTGRSQGAELGEQVERTRRQIGGQVVAFRRASEEGARAMLKVLSPAVIEAEASRGASFLEKRFGIAAQCWELFGRRLEELRASPELYQTHFDGPLRKEMHRLAQDRRGTHG